ncbi:hypothetical protein HHK36_030065 [Tetracentron sinense]|uniref:DUF674 family protein n=1 Tax=Tetracentron sinense TaxID=13715 RepID=A0A835D2B2_TETSI|nr:hypothetical protein HHK36_030065 [Tetracentron sinense]
MTERQLKSISLKVLVDKENNRVVFAESDKDFVDVLFSFLTMPIGTIIRLIRSQPFVVEIGCMNNVYESVDKLDVQHLCTLACKTMLLSPRNSAERHCRNLKVNIDDTELPQYYICRSDMCCEWTHSVMSTYENVQCRCGEVMERKLSFTPAIVLGAKQGVFVNETATFIISDDLHVTPMSTMTSFSLLSKLRIKGRSSVEERTVNIEVLHLLISLLSSETPLTNLVLLERVIGDPIQLDQRNMIQPKNERDADSDGKKLRVKLMLSKSKNKVLYAEAGEDFVDLLLSFLTFPLGSIVDLLGGSSPFQCVNTLYKSVEHLSVDNYFKSDKCKNMLIHPKLSPDFGCDNKLLWIEEAIHPNHYSFHCKYCFHYEHLKISTVADTAPESCRHGKSRFYFNVVNPKLLTGESRRGGGFLKGPAMFMVTDDLVVTPLSSISAISLLDSLNVPISDVEERVVTVGNKEALSLLRASLVSKSALTDAFSFNFSLKKPKQEK